MPKKTTALSGMERWSLFHEEWRRFVPHVTSVLANEEDFVALHVKARPDGTSLAFIKKFDESGGPVICFGSGYGVVASLLALDASVQGGNWKVDKPWGGKGK